MTTKPVSNISSILFVLALVSRKAETKIKNANKANVDQAFAIPHSLPWSQRLALSSMKRYPEAWQAEDDIKKEWDCEKGLLLAAFEKLCKHTYQQECFDYIKTFADTLIDTSGSIRNYKIDSYTMNITSMNP